MKITNDIRKRIVDAYSNGVNKKQLSISFGIKLTTMNEIINVFKKENRWEVKLKGGIRHTKLNSEEILFIQSLINEDCSITLKSIQQCVLSQFSISASLASISNVIKGFNYSFKRVSLIPDKRNTPENIEIRAQYAESYMGLLSEIDDNKVFFIDEVGFNLSMHSHYGRSLKGTRATQNVLGLRSHNYSVCCAMSKNKVEYFSVQNTAFKIDSFEQYVFALIRKLHEQGIMDGVFIMDNVAFHKNIRVQDAILSGGFSPFFLPPYSPFLNPIENAFSKWKQYVRALKPNTEEELFTIIDNVYDIITREDCNGYFCHIFVFIRLSLSRVAILDG